ncbi:oxidoreductase [Staphylococcus arlettae]|uniref:oxidoreductase n=1 Tax=Staphylococcus arlettae TaxID=29378 RepID=UPI001E524A4C|nr:oxidoreductase [Staphylococcus arlettae]MCD8839321.1 SDR family NAD(P)-dependent oxidoreductase [Staphylococcus arlettae]MCD8866897.1 SDR family NAD(P)-dependent oxidoreductase [Staphylococcus arlettae]
MKVVLITGASSGIGFETAKLLAQKGYRVYGAARRVEAMKALEQLGVTPIKLDVTDNDSMHNTIDTLIGKEKRIDVIINNAGYGSFGAIEDVEEEEARRQFDVNLFAVAKLIKLVLPYMRQQRCGKIINISSMNGRIPAYLGGWYSATKYALEGFSDSLRLEVSDFGIDVVLIEPGPIKTEWSLISANYLERSARGGAYEATATRVAESLRRQYEKNMMSDPAVIAKYIAKSIDSKKSKSRYLVGFGAKPLILLHAILPTKTFDLLIKNLVNSTKR